MYGKLFWDDLYRAHLLDVPWMSDTHTQRHLNIITKYLVDVTGKTLLDYGCGNGRIAYHFYELGAIVTLADISETLVNWLLKEYASTSIQVVTAATPFDINHKEHSYDIVIAGALFHHIQPELWYSFLIGFADLLKPGGQMIISGWDESDVLFSKTNRAPYTNEPTWPINSLRSVIVSSGLYRIIDETQYDYTLPEFFYEHRVFRFFNLQRHF